MQQKGTLKNRSIEINNCNSIQSFVVALHSHIFGFNIPAPFASGSFLFKDGGNL